MKKPRLFLYLMILIAIVLTGCGIKDVTDSAEKLIDDADQLLRSVDSMVESGELEREVADLIDGRVENLMSELAAALENGGGFLFDSANGTIDNIFANISALLSEIMEHLDESVPSLLESLSYQLQLQVNLIGGQLENVIVITFGNTFVLVDKTTNSIIIIASIVLLAIGIIVFVLLLIKGRGGKRGAGIIIAYSLIGVYILFFLLVILVTPVRGYMIAGFNFGEKYEGVGFEPKITGIIPENFVFGKNERIIVYGNNLNKIQNTQVHLFQGPEKKLTFPPNAVVVATRNRIILGNFDTELGWVVPPYENYEQEVIPPDASSQLRARYTKVATEISKFMYPDRILAEPATVTPVPPTLLILQPTPIATAEAVVVERLSEATRISLPKMVRIKEQIAPLKNKIYEKYEGIFGSIQSQEILTRTESFFLESFDLPEGDFGLGVYDGEDKVESSQFISLVNPPPPAPRPDISPIGLAWTGGVPAVEGERVTLTVRLGFTHPEEIKAPLRIRILVNPPRVNAINFTVPESLIAATGSTNFIDVISSSFTAPQAGTYTFTVYVDPDNRIEEVRDDNNSLQRSLPVKQYVYDTTIKFTTFQATKNMDSWPDAKDEYRISFTVNVTGYSAWSFNYRKNGEPNNNYQIDKSKKFSSLTPGDVISVHTSGREADSGIKDGDDGMGSFTKVISLGNDPTHDRDSEERSYVLKPKHYNAYFTVKFERKIQ